MAKLVDDFISPILDEGSKPSTSTILMVDLLDLLFPKRCVYCGKFGAYFCPKCKAKIQYLENQFCPECALPSISGATHPRCKKKYSLDGILSAFYFSGPAKAAIHKLKYKLVSDLAEELIGLLSSKIQIVEAMKNLKHNKFILIPVPLHKKRERWRGFNQAKVLGEKIAEKFKFDSQDGTLKRIKDTVAQVDLGRKERLKNVSGAFEVTSDGEIFNKNFLLIDDVATSGATLTSCARALKQRGASSVWALTLARQIQKSFEGKSKI